MNITQIAFRNICRKWHRTLVTTLAMGFSGLIMILFAALMQGMLQASERNAVEMDLGDLQIHAIGFRDDPDLYNRIKAPEALVKKIEAAGFHAASRLYGFGLLASGKASSGVQMRGLDVLAEKEVTQIHHHLMTGEWLDIEDAIGVVIGKRLAKTLGVQVGGELVFVGQSADGSIANELYRVRGILKSLGDITDRSGLFMLESAFRELFVMPEGSHEIAIMRIDRRTDLAQAKRQVIANAEGYEVLDWRQLRPVLARILDLVDIQVIIMIVITYIAVAMLVLNAMLMGVFERIREFGIMKAIGVTPFQIILLIYVETLIQTTLASLIAIIFGFLGATHLQKNGIDLSDMMGEASFGGVAIDPIWRAHLTMDSMLTPILFLFVMAMVSVLYPAMKAAMIQPVDAIHFQ